MLYKLCKLDSQVKINKNKHIMAKICNHNLKKSHLVNKVQSTFVDKHSWYYLLLKTIWYLYKVYTVYSYPYHLCTVCSDRTVFDTNPKVIETPIFCPLRLRGTYFILQETPQNETLKGGWGRFKKISYVKIGHAIFRSTIVEKKDQLLSSICSGYP